MMEGARCFGYLRSRFESQTTGPQTTNLPLPIGSMYDIFTYMWSILMMNVGKYTIHESYGLVEPNALTNNDALTAQIGLTVPTDSRSTLLWSCHLKHYIHEEGYYTHIYIYIYIGIQNVFQNKYLYQSVKYIKNRIRKLDSHRTKKQARIDAPENIYTICVLAQHGKSFFPLVFHGMLLGKNRA